MSTTRQILVAQMTWQDVARRLAEGTAAILPIGAGAKQHGLHLPMATDQTQADWFAARLSEEIDALVWPTVTYGSYPAFVAYAGSVSLSEETFEAVVKEIVEALNQYGARRIFVLNTGVSTIVPIDRVLASMQVQASVGHLRIYSGRRYQRAVSEICQQRYGSHADEIETSIMLAMAPELVNMALAQASPDRGIRPGPGPLSPVDAASPNFSPSGSFGDPRLATVQKGRALIEAIMGDMIEAISLSDQSR